MKRLRPHYVHNKATSFSLDSKLQATLQNQHIAFVQRQHQPVSDCRGISSV